MPELPSKKCKELDAALIQEFCSKRKKTIKNRLALPTNTSQFRSIKQKLEKAGAFDIRVEEHLVKDIDGDRWRMTIARAATTDMWPMGTHYWVRDNSIIGARLLFSGEARLMHRGKQILLSALSFMSSQSQLKRFHNIIRSKSKTFRNDAASWPYIFAAVADNLNTSKLEGWAHKQDAWQILAWYLLEAIDRKLISTNELTKKQRKFLGAIIPFLARVEFWRCENSGSWEEIPAVRSSVRAWEHRLIVRLAEFSNRTEFSFLEKEYLSFRKSLAKSYATLGLVGAIQLMERQVVKAMLRDLPHESPDYARKDPRYRTADGALIYLLQLDYPNFLAARCGKSPEWAAILQQKLLANVLSLVDKKSGGIYRYGNDSYQRSGFFRNETVRKLKELYGAPSGNASSHFVGRGKVVPRGRKAAWTHFVWQLAAWAGEMYLKTQNAKFLSIHNRFFKQGIGLITGEHEVSIDQDSSDKLRTISLPSLRMPECYIADVDTRGNESIFPSPHTPLNWAVAEMRKAFEIRAKLL